MKRLKATAFLTLILLLQRGVDSLKPRHHHPICELLRNYNPLIPPFPKNGSPLVVYLGFTPICLELTEEGHLEGTLWYSWSWVDHRLSWEADNTSSPEIAVPKDRLYVPDILPISNNFRESFDPNERAEVHRNGSVFLHQRVILKGPCTGYDWKDPWAPMDCALTISPWTHTGATMELKHMPGTTPLDNYQKGCPVEVLKVQTHHWNQYHLDMEHPYIFYDLNLVLQRNWMTKTRGKDVAQAH